LNESRGNIDPQPTLASAAAALVQRVAAGDREAEGELVARYGRGVELLLLRHTRSRQEAEDLYQETFLVALGKLREGQLREAEKLPGFLAGIARNLALETYRKHTRRRTEADSEGVQEHATVAPSQLGATLHREQAVLLRQVLGELPTPRDREILFRFYLGEEDRDAIAADLGLTGGQFNRVLHRARDRYRELLRPHLGQMLAILGLLVFCLR
jgi:RNA polymerase sigma-70 factor (ECF subfamily)